MAPPPALRVDPPRHLVLVPHTHWDREWYRTQEDFRSRLVRLMDGLLDLLEGDPGFRHFTLDGQTIVLEDYLEVRPRARERLAKLVREGRLLVGPWYVLPDEWLVSGEALIRNLRLGLEQAAGFGGGMRLGYVPDQFGHVGQLPQIFRGFGLDAAVLWRGVGDDVEETLFDWEAPDGSRLLTAYLIHGYGNAVHLPLEPDALARRLAGEAQALGARSRVPTLLLMNGSDHAEPQPGLPVALERALARCEGLSAEIATLPAYVERARGEVRRALPLHRGELRSGLRSPLLEGCASARLPQKRADFENDRLLTRYAEPLSAWLEALGGDGDPELLAHAWRIALQNHPHDSICGCSIDAVHEQMEARFARVRDVATAQLRRVTHELGGRVAAPPGSLLVWNPHPTGAALAEGEVELDVAAGARPPALHLRDAAGRRLPLEAEVVAPGAVAARFTLDARGAGVVLRGFPPEFTGLFPCGLHWRRRGRGGRGEGVAGWSADLLLGSEPPAGFSLASAIDALLADLGDGGVELSIRRLPRLRLRFADVFPGCGLRVYRVARGAAPPGEELRSGQAADGGVAIENAHWRVEATRDGRVDLHHRASGRVVRDALRLVSEGDRGDEYTFDPVPGSPPVERPEAARVRLRSVTGAAAIAIDARYRVPAELARGRAARSARRAALRARIELSLAAGLDRVDVAIHVESRARDHRLRVHLRAPFAPERFEVESAFEIAERPIAPGPGDFGSEGPSELPTGATPQRGFATLAGEGRALTVANRGASEVEALREADGRGALAVTVLRAVGWLSRDDLVMRPGHAGPPLETPGAQVPGAHRCELSLRLHPAGDRARAAEAHRFAAPPLAFVGGGGEGPLADGARLLELDEPGVLVSAIEPRPDAAPLVRLWRAEAEGDESDESGDGARVTPRWNAPGARGLERVDLAGRPLPGAAAEDAGGSFALPNARLLCLRPR